MDPLNKYGFTYQREYLADVLPEMMELSKEHYDEIARMSRSIENNPVTELYLELESKGFLITTVVRDKDDIMIGYYVSLLHEFLHSRGVMFADSDLIFLKKENRTGLAGYYLVKYMDELLVSLGADAILCNFKHDRPMKSIMDRLGYKPFEVKYFRQVKS